MEEMKLTRMELLPDEWLKDDPRCPEHELRWALDDLVESLRNGTWTLDELRDLDLRLYADEGKDGLYWWIPSELAEELEKAAQKIRSLTIKPESGYRN